MTEKGYCKKMNCPKPERRRNIVTMGNIVSGIFICLERCEQDKDFTRVGKKNETYSIYLNWQGSYHRICEPRNYRSCVESAEQWADDGYATRLKETHYDEEKRMVVEV